MARKEYPPAIAARIDKSDYDYLYDVAERRKEYLSDVVRIALRDYVEKLKRLDERRNT